MLLYDIIYHYVTAEEKSPTDTEEKPSEPEKPTAEETKPEEKVTEQPKDQAKPDSPPNILENMADVVVTSPEVIVLTFSAQPGLPNSEATWTKDGKPVNLKDSKKYDISTMGEQVTLEIKDSQPTDSGVYKCQLKNKLGSVETKATVTVLGKHDNIYN